MASTLIYNKSELGRMSKMHFPLIFSDFHFQISTWDIMSLAAKRRSSNNARPPHHAQWAKNLKKYPKTSIIWPFQMTRILQYTGSKSKNNQKNDFFKLQNLNFVSISWIFGSLCASTTLRWLPKCTLAKKSWEAGFFQFCSWFYRNVPSLAKV